MTIISSLIVSFILTLVIEYIIIKLIFFKKQVFKPVLLVNLLTNPLIVYIYNMMSLFNFVYINIAVIIMEILVVIVEGIVYKYLLDLSFKKAFLVAFIANATSFLIGLFI